MEQLMKEEQAMLLALFDSLWFQLSILGTTIQQIQSNTTSLYDEEQESPNQQVEAEEPQEEEHPDQHHLPSIQQQSPERKLYTILSGKEATADDSKGDEIEQLKMFPTLNLTIATEAHPKSSRINKKMDPKKKKKKSKSMSELEFEELKGFVDLGFLSVSEAEVADPRLISIVPGLQRLRKERGTVDDTAMFGPYLSDAWELRRRMDLENALRSWRLPAPGQGVDLKHHIRSWAHTVASTVR